MLTRIYEIDHDALETFFGEDARPIPIATLHDDHGELLFEGKISPHPDAGDVIVLPMDGENYEYVIVCRIYILNERSDSDDAEAVLIVHERHFDTESLS